MSALLAASNAAKSAWLIFPRAFVSVCVELRLFSSGAAPFNLTVAVGVIPIDSTSRSVDNADKTPEDTFRSGRGDQMGRRNCLAAEGVGRRKLRIEIGRTNALAAGARM